MQRLAVLCAALALGGCATTASNTQDVDAKILWAGSYLKDFSKISTGTKVVAALDEDFGIEFKFSGVKEGTPVRYRQVTRYPAPGRTLESGEVRQYSEAKESTCKAGNRCMVGWRFDTPDELIPGTWAIEIQVDGRTLASQRFDVAPRTDTKQLPKGLWAADVTYDSLPHESDLFSGTYKEIYTNCDGNPRMWWWRDGKSRRIAVPFQVRSFEGTHVLSAFTKFHGDEPGWVESTIWTLTELREDVFVARLSRSVHNRSYAFDAPQKSFGTTGYGEFRKVDDDCLGLDH